MSTETRGVWIERFRPDDLDDVKGQVQTVKALKQYVNEGDIPNLLFSGPPGVGKTASAVAIARELYGDSWEDNFLELNASDERGIDVVRDRVKKFARASASNVDFRIIFLDEADALTPDAQSALRRTMERYAGNVRFILSCNYASKIIEAIQSRCSRYRFTPLSDEAVEEQIREITESEGIQITDDAVDALVYASNGDMRRAINGLQAVSILDDEEITEERVFLVTNTIKPEEVREILETAISGDFVEARRQTREIMNEKGVASNELLTQLHQAIWSELDLEAAQSVEVSDILGEVDYRISQGADENIQIDSLLSKLSDV